MTPKILLLSAVLSGFLLPGTRASAQEDAAPTPPRPRILGLSHVGMWVKDIELSRAFYKDYLGFGEPFSVKNKAGDVRITWIKINDRQTLELFPISEKTPKNGDSFYHIAFETDDAQGMLTYLIAKGVKGPGGKALSPTIKPGQIGNLGYFVEDPDGHIVEMVQYMPEGWTLQHKGEFMPDTRVSMRMSHTGVSVGNLDACMKFYGDILGFKEFWRGSSNGKVLNWVNLRVPDGNDYLEVMLYGKKPNVDRLHTLNHVCLEVADLQPVEATLKGRTLPAVCKPTAAIKVGVNGKRQINCYDPDGTRVEVMEAMTADGKPVPPSKAPPPTPEAGT